MRTLYFSTPRVRWASNLFVIHPSLLIKKLPLSEVQSHPFTINQNEKRHLGNLTLLHTSMQLGTMQWGSEFSKSDVFDTSRSSLFVDIQIWENLWKSRCKSSSPNTTDTGSRDRHGKTTGTNLRFEGFPKRNVQISAGDEGKIENSANPCLDFTCSCLLRTSRIWIWIWIYIRFTAAPRLPSHKVLQVEMGFQGKKSQPVPEAWAKASTSLDLRLWVPAVQACRYHFMTFLFSFSAYSTPPKAHFVYYSGQKYGNSSTFCHGSWFDAIYWSFLSHFLFLLNPTQPSRASWHLFHQKKFDYWLLTTVSELHMFFRTCHGAHTPLRKSGRSMGASHAQHVPPFSSEVCTAPEPVIPRNYEQPKHRLSLHRRPSCFPSRLGSIEVSQRVTVGTSGQSEEEWG